MIILGLVFLRRNVEEQQKSLFTAITDVVSFFSTWQTFLYCLCSRHCWLTGWGLCDTSMQSSVAVADRMLYLVISDLVHTQFGHSESACFVRKHS